MPRNDPRLLTVTGAACISLSAILMKVSGTSAGTATLFRCLLALPVLVPLALAERRRLAPRPARQAATDLVAGAFLGTDFVFFGHCIQAVGAGVATVLVNVQVIIVPLLALLLLRERPTRRFLTTAPILLTGVTLASGAIGGTTSGGDPLRGLLFGLAAGIGYAGCLIGLRRGGQHGHRYQPVCLTTIGAAATAAVLGAAWGGIDLTPGWPAIGWLAALALSGQVVGWLLIGAALPRLSSATGAALLLIQPVGSVLLGIALLHEHPTVWQLTGSAIVIAAVWAVSAGTHHTTHTPRQSAETVAHQEI